MCRVSAFWSRVRLSGERSGVGRARDGVESVGLVEYFEHAARDDLDLDGDGGHVGLREDAVAVQVEGPAKKTRGRAAAEGGGIRPKETKEPGIYIICM